MKTARKRMLRSRSIGAWRRRRGGGLRLARRGVAALLLEAEPELALGASGTNSGILHTGFDSHAGRAGDAADPALGRAARGRARRARHSGAALRGRARAPRRGRGRETVAAIAAAAERNGVAASAARGRDAGGPGGVRSPTRSPTPTLWPRAAAGGGAEVRTGAGSRRSSARDGRLDAGTGRR